jgi:hypothetical protein
MVRQKSNLLRVLFFRLLIAMPLLLLVGMGGYLIFSNQTIILGEFVLSDADLPPIRLVEDASIDGLDIFATGNRLGDGRVYGLYATTVRDADFSFINDEGFIDFNNDLNLNNIQETIYVVFENI